MNQLKKLKYSIVFMTNLVYSTYAQPISDYIPEKVEFSTNEIIDSVFVLMDSTRLYIADPELENCKYIKYWNSHKSMIPEKDYFNLINHQSPIIRYHSYRYILEKELVSSKLEFINHHLADVQGIQYVTDSYQLNELTWRLVENRWVKTGPGFRPLIVHLVTTADLEEKEKEILYRAIIQENINSALVTEFPLSQLTLDDSNYAVIKSLALQGNTDAIARLSEYQKEENEVFLLNHFDSIFIHKTDRDNIY